jgi:hypothetical protein
MTRQPGSAGLLQRVAAACTLGLLAPLVAEYLLGDFRISNLAPLPLFICTYGCGAVSIREIVRRKGGSWTAYLALAAAYSILEEGIVDQSLFNPNFMHLHLLAYGFWPILGTSPFWVVCVTVLHAVWSIAVPIGMTESLFPDRSSEPWLGRFGLAVAAFLFFLGSFAVGAYFHRTASHRASMPQIALCAVLILGLLTIAFLSRRSEAAAGARIPGCAPFWLGAFCFFTGLALVESYTLGAFILRWPGTVAGAVELGLVILALLLLCKIWPRAWTPLEVWWATTGCLLVYVFHGYEVDRALHGAAGLLGHTAIVLGLCAVQAGARFRVAHVRAGRA